MYLSMYSPATSLGHIAMGYGGISHIVKPHGRAVCLVK